MNKICVVVTARPSYSRVRSVLQALSKNVEVELDIVLSGTANIDKYGDIEPLLHADRLKISENLSTVVSGDRPAIMGNTTALALSKLSDYFERCRPNAVVTIADRFETISTSIAASYQNIPLVHFQGGERTGNIDDRVRNANTKLSDYHYVSTKQAERTVIGMGEEPTRVFNFGCPSLDIAKPIRNLKNLDFDPIKKYGGVGANIDFKKEYIVALQHPHTLTAETARIEIEETIRALKEVGLPVAMFWPNIDSGHDLTSKAIRTFRENNVELPFRFFKNLSSEDFLKLIRFSKCLVGNSSAGIREAGFLGVPVINIGGRQNGRERASNVIECNCDAGEIKNAILNQLRHGNLFEQSNLYGDGDSGIKIANHLAQLNFSLK